MRRAPRGAEQSQIVGVGAASERVRPDVINLQQMLGGAAPPGHRVSVAAAAGVALPDPALDRLRDRPPDGAFLGAEVLALAGSVADSAGEVPLGAGFRSDFAAEVALASARRCGFAVEGAFAAGFWSDFGAEPPARRLPRRPGSWRSSPSARRPGAAACASRPTSSPVPRTSSTRWCATGAASAPQALAHTHRRSPPSAPTSRP